MDFVAFPKIPRLNREIVITEKIDGTNASVWISPDKTEVRAGSRTRWITPEDDNFGFAKWVRDNQEELTRLGPGHHFGEWWGRGIQRNYNMTERKFSLFNVHRFKDVRPACCDLVPVVSTGVFSQILIDTALKTLSEFGSLASPGFKDAEGIMIYHTAANKIFKVTLKDDEKGKGE